jgi:hypothetical protein
MYNISVKRSFLPSSGAIPVCCLVAETASGDGNVSLNWAPVAGTYFGMAMGYTMLRKEGHVKPSCASYRVCRHRAWSMMNRVGHQIHYRYKCNDRSHTPHIFTLLFRPP